MKDLETPQWARDHGAAVGETVKIKDGDLYHTTAAMVAALSGIVSVLLRIESSLEEIRKNGGRR